MRRRYDNSGATIKTTPYTAAFFEFGQDRPKPDADTMQIIFAPKEDSSSEQSDVYAVDFVCPCGCGHTCFTPVCSMDDKRAAQAAGIKKHAWGFDPATLTLNPSIRWLSGCKAHFNIENGRAIFHGDSGK